jgi:hypothetical protein
MQRLSFTANDFPDTACAALEVPSRRMASFLSVGISGMREVLDTKVFISSCRRPLTALMVSVIIKDNYSLYGKRGLRLILARQRIP